jgi:hypothetical protein
MRPNRKQSVSFVSIALLCAGLTAMAQTPLQSRDGLEIVVALTTATCPTVSPLTLVSLDWNPGFEHESAVTGINHFGLVFAPVAADGSTVITHPNGHPSHYVARSVSATPTANGYYHLEFRLSNPIPPGLYRVVDAGAAPQVQPEYQGPAPKMTVSPARDRLCITVANSPRGVVPPVTATPSPQLQNVPPG